MCPQGRFPDHEGVRERQKICPEIHGWAPIHSPSSASTARQVWQKHWRSAQKHSSWWYLAIVPTGNKSLRAGASFILTGHKYPTPIFPCTANFDVLKLDTQISRLLLNLLCRLLRVSFLFLGKMRAQDVCPPGFEPRASAGAAAFGCLLGRCQTALRARDARWCSSRAMSHRIIES